MTKMKYRDALRAALFEEMTDDPSVFCVGEGIGERGGSYKVTEGLIAEFGAGRVRDTPLSEAGFVGLGVGAAIAGQRPVVEVLFIDFLLQAMDQVVNQAAKYRFMSGGEGRVPLVIRTQGGAGNSLAGQHSQSLEALVYHIPGLKVVMPATPHDAKGLLKAAIRDEDPVVFIEHKLLYMTDGEVPDEPYEIPLGKADVKRAGTDVTLVAWSHMVLKSLQAAEELAADGISVEVIDLRTLVPMDIACVLDSVRRTGRLVVAQEAIKRGGVGQRRRGDGGRAGVRQPEGADRPRGRASTRWCRSTSRSRRRPCPRSPTSWPASDPCWPPRGDARRLTAAPTDSALVHPPPAGDDQQLTRDERRVRRGEESRGRGDVVRRPPAVERGLVEDPLLDLLVDVLEHVGPDPARADGVHRHVRAEREGEGLGQPVQAGLRDDVLGELHRRRVVEPRVGRHVDDRPALLGDHDRGDGLGAQVRCP